MVKYMGVLHRKQHCCLMLTQGKAKPYKSHFAKHKFQYRFYKTKTSFHLKVGGMYTDTDERVTSESDYVLPGSVKAGYLIGSK